jgi:hypothetical protein
MKTLIFGSLMGLFGAFAVFLSITIGWPGWVLFMTWVCFYLFGKSIKKSLNIYLQIVLGICLGILIETLGGIFLESVGMLGLYLAIFLLIGSLAFLTRIKGLNDIAAWFIGLIVFFGVEPHIEILPITKMLLLPLATGFLFGYVLDTIITKYVYPDTGTNSH